MINVTVPDVREKEAYLFQFLLILAKIYLPVRLGDCARKVGVNFNKVRVGDQKNALGIMFVRKSDFPELENLTFRLRDWRICAFP